MANERQFCGDNRPPQTPHAADMKFPKSTAADCRCEARDASVNFVTQYTSQGRKGFETLGNIHGT